MCHSECCAATTLLVWISGTGCLKLGVRNWMWVGKRTWNRTIRAFFENTLTSLLSSNFVLENPGVVNALGHFRGSAVEGRPPRTKQAGEQLFPLRWIFFCLNGR
jgi:hypothetical protein